MLSLLSGAVLIGLVYGLSFFPTATLTRPDDTVLGLAEDDSAMPDSEDIASSSDARTHDAT